MLAIHPVHRRLAELQLKAERLGGYNKLSTREQQDLNHCMRVNADLVSELDSLKQLSLHAYEVGDMDWQHEICRKINELESRFT